MLELLRQTNPICTPGWTIAGRTFGDAMFGLPPRARIVLEGAEHLRTLREGPAIVSPNHTHKFDFFPLRCALLHQGQQLMTWIKARDYKHPAMRWILGKGGNIPLASRGYLIAADFAQVHGRRPTEDEYRALRDHVDTEAPLPDDLARMLAPRRAMAGVAVSFDGGYRGAVREAYRTLLGEALLHARRGRDLGRHQHIYPQGATSKQLTPGHPGAVQAALALGVPIVPVGMSGCREVFLGKDHPLTRGGTVIIRIGAPITIDPGVVPSDFRPFDPDHEDRHHTALQGETDRVMTAINALCEPSYRWADDLVSDAKRGVARFYS